MEQHGAACVEHALRRISDQLVAAFSGQASLSRYQPNRFLLHFYGSSVKECHACVAPILEQINAPEFFSMHGEAISIRSVSNYWFCNRGIGTEELLEWLDEGGDPVTEAPITSSQVSDSNVDADVVESEPKPETVPEKPFSIEDLAPFPSPWDDPPEESPPSESTVATSVQSDADAATNGADDLGSSIEPMLESAHEIEVSASGGSDSVEGFASPGDIANLLAQLQPKKTPATSSETVANSKLPSMDPDADSQEPEPAIAQSVGLEMPPMAPESPKKKSIYTDDIEDTVLESDLASLFATVRSSAAGDFGYEGAPATGGAPVTSASPEPGAERS
jgi:hypothetical protein